MSQESTLSASNYPGAAHNGDVLRRFMTLQSLGGRDRGSGKSGIIWRHPILDRRWLRKNDRMPPFDRLCGVEISSTGPAQTGAFGPPLGGIFDRFTPSIAYARLSGIRSDSPAKESGLQGGDVTVKFGGTTIRSLSALRIESSIYLPLHRRIL
jgi:hypothetical protein